jgi:REP element-mobilizing transposase RayT
LAIMPKRGIKQLALALPRWGGKRKGAGRPRKDGRRGPGVSHLRRPKLAARFPVHVTWRTAEGVWSLRSHRSFTRLTRAFYTSAIRFGYRIVHYAVMGNHVHLIVEARDEGLLAIGMQSLGIRIAQSLNRMMQRKGRVLADRYHARILKTPTEVRHCVGYLQTNAQKHYQLPPGPDPFASDEPFMRPQTWFLKRLE